MSIISKIIPISWVLYSDLIFITQILISYGAQLFTRKIIKKSGEILL